MSGITQFKGKVKMVNLKCMKRLFKLYNSSGVNKEIHDAGVSNIDILFFCDDRDDKRFLKLVIWL